ncbi:endonuclease domain-containing protein [Paraburkholderia atlantica]|uniref:endonuclease domain-containing protein n=1 Tax=Paraburkholderia atlantica TaxID=2654982 RepID=UPI0003021F87|nr:endonuclease domain-containing protein [Paraburkholderia atlantica]
MADEIASALRTRAPAPLDAALSTMVSAPRAKVTTAPSAIEELFALHVRADKLPAPAREYQFDPARKWRFDFAWTDRRLAVEVEGGIHSGGRHTRGAGFEADARKYLAATLAGWSVVRVTGKMVRDGSAIAAVRELLARQR